MNTVTELGLLRRVLQGIAIVILLSWLMPALASRPADAQVIPGFDPATRSEFPPAGDISRRHAGDLPIIDRSTGPVFRPTNATELS